MNKNNTSSKKTLRAVSGWQVIFATMFAGLFFGITSPSPANSWIVIAGGVTLGALLYVWYAMLVRLLAVFWAFPIHQQRLLAGVLTVTTMFIVLLQSIGEMSWRDVLVVIPLVIIFYIYAAYASQEQKLPRSAEH